MARFLPDIPARLQKIDDLIRNEHFHLTGDDDCYFLWEWDGAPYADSAITDFIGNFQKDTRFRGEYSWNYKKGAILHAAHAISSTILPEWRSSIFVPVPPSKTKDDPKHDSRLIDTLGLVQPALEIHELVVQLKNTQSREKGIPPRTRAHNWALKCDSLKKMPKHFVVFDDLLTGASHFAAMKVVLARQFQGVPVIGFFLARRVGTNAADDPSS